MKQKAISVFLALALVAIGFVVVPASRVLAGSCTSQANSDWFTASTWGDRLHGDRRYPRNWR